jgi:hypothetical protein
VSAVLSPTVLNHSLSAFLLGGAHARRFAIDFDEEGFYLAALFYDLGLFPGHRGRGRIGAIRPSVAPLIEEASRPG